MAHFLLVDDNVFTSEMLEAALSMWGHSADIAMDGEQATRMVLATEYDAIVTNHDMPRVNGPEFLRRVAERIEGRTPCAMDSGHVDPAIVDASRESGAFWFLPLPFEIAEFRLVVEQMLKVRRAFLTPDNLTVEEIRIETNAEVRRVLRETYGEGRYLAETGARLVHLDSVPVDYFAPGSAAITRALLADDEGRHFLVASDGSTQRVYYMEVPDTATTCQAAYEALSGRPGVRTIVEA